jgi:hypothetical protein
MGSVGAFAPLGASVFGCDVSYAQLCAFPAVAGSFQTPCWREMDSKFRFLVATPSHRHGRRTALEAGADLSGNRKFESISLQQRVRNEPCGCRRSPRADECRAPAAARSSPCRQSRARDPGWPAARASSPPLRRRGQVMRIADRDLRLQRGFLGQRQPVVSSVGHRGSSVCSYRASNFG